MDDGYSFFCGSVPILLLLWRGGGGPRPLLLLLAGCIGGLASYMVFGRALAPNAGAMEIFTIAVAGGAFAGIAVDAALNMAGGRAETRVG